jgi:hypothetical protein
MPFDDRAELRDALTEMVPGDTSTDAGPGGMTARGMGPRTRSARENVHEGSLREEAP